MNFLRRKDLLKRGQTYRPKKRGQTLTKKKRGQTSYVILYAEKDVHCSIKAIVLWKDENLSERLFLNSDIYTCV